jgi:hypothetical protein
MMSQEAELIKNQMISQEAGSIKSTNEQPRGRIDREYK